MISVAVGAITCIAILLTRVLFVWQRNFKIAKTAEFPTFHSPFHTDDLWWLAIQEWIAPYFEKLPTTWTRPWLPFARIWKLWHVGYQPFAEVGSDTLLLASPSGNTLWTCDNKIAKQIYSLPTVQTPVKSMEFLNIWGPTIATVEGQEWKIHRKAVTNGFNPSTYELVWEEAIFQIEELIKYWGENGDFTVSNIMPWAIRVALHVLSSALFNRRLQWKDQSLQGSDKKQSSDRLNFPDALTTVVSRVGLILVTPRILFRLPVKGLQKVGQALEDLTFYMNSMRSRTIERSQEIISHPRMSLLESIVLAGMPEYTASHSSSSSMTLQHPDFVRAL